MSSRLAAAQAHYYEVMNRGNATEGQEGRAEAELRAAEREAGLGGGSSNAKSELAAARAEYEEVMSRGNATEGQEGRAEARLRRAEAACRY